MEERPRSVPAPPEDQTASSWLKPAHTWVAPPQHVRPRYLQRQRAADDDDGDGGAAA